MNKIFLLFLSLSLSGSIIALFLLILKPLLKDRLSKTWQYYIWLVVIIRLLIPFSAEYSIVGSLFHQGINYLMPQTSSITSAAPAMRISTEAEITNSMVEQKDSPETQGIGDENTPLSGYWKTVMANIWLFWLLVAIMQLVSKIIGYYSFVKCIKGSNSKCLDVSLGTTYKNIYESMSLKTPPPIYANSMAAAPMLIGFFHPILVLSDTNIAADELRYILRHELTHYKRLDIFYKWTVQTVVCLHWFNPLVYWISREINSNCELSCDEKVIKDLDENGRFDYGETLLSSIKPIGGYTNPNISISLNEDTKLLKERLDAIMKFRKKSKVTVIASMILAMLLFCGATFTGAYATTVVPSNFQVSSNGTKYHYNNANDNAKIKVDVKKSASDENTVDHSIVYAPYFEYGLTVEQKSGKDILFYNGRRVRLFIDKRTDNSFELCHTDELGIMDIMAVKDTQGKISGIDFIPEDEARKLLIDLDMDKTTGEYDNPATTDEADSIIEDEKEPYRLNLVQLPKELKNWIKKCDKKKDLYVTVHNGRYYVYCNLITGDFAWKPTVDSDGNMVVKLYQLNRSGEKNSSRYALLSIPSYDTLLVKYKDKTIRHEMI